MRLAVLVLVLSGSTAFAQGVDRRYAEEPTGGIAMPTTPLAGEYDARAAVANPGGLPLLRGLEVALAMTVEDDAVATSGGPGVGLFAGGAAGGSLLPRFGWGVGLEWLRPARAQLVPDPGAPFRGTLSLGVGLGPSAGVGIAWHHFRGEGVLGGVDAFDLGGSLRLDNHLALGATIRDIDTLPIANVPVQRRYEAEALIRPLGTDCLELALGGRIGEIRADVDGWVRLSGRIVPGLYAHAQLETRDLHTLVDSATGVDDRHGRDARVTLGIEVSLGNFGATTLVTGLRDDTGATHALGGTVILRGSVIGPASIAGTPDHVERVELSGEIGSRELTAIVMRLRSIARDPSAKALVVTFDGTTAGWATLQELRGEILAVKTKKKVFAYMVSGNGRDYYVASAASKIYVDPAGGLRLIGMATTTMYFRGALDLVGVIPQFEKIAEYKSAPEQFTNTGPSEIAQKMHDDLLDSLWDQWLDAIATGRHLTKDEVKAIVDAGPYSAGTLAQNTKLVDAVAAPDKIADLVTAELGVALQVDRAAADRPERWRDPRIAIIYIEGDITDGASKSIPLVGEKLAGGETIIRAITTARADDRIGAIILRINSPGGSALASELIAREVFATRGVKPILCSMGDLAASGGYFAAAGCETIFAQPMTITGSIGIFTGKFDLAGLAAKLGVSVETYRRGKRADAESYFRPYTEDERQALMGQLRYMYNRFIGAVAEGRGLTKEAVDAAGRGHVYTGTQAMPIKLVDKFGGLGDALDEAKHRLGLARDTKVSLVELPLPPTGLFGAIGSLLGLHAEAKLELTDLPGVKQLLRSVPASVLVAPEVPQARLPFDLVWQ